MQPVTLYVTINVSINTTSCPVFPTRLDESPPGEVRKPSMAQDSTKTTRPIVATGSETLSPPTDHLPGEVTTSMLPAADDNARMSPAKNALRNADEAMTAINLSNTWEGALERIKWVMDTVSPVAEVRAMSFSPILD